EAIPGGGARHLALGGPQQLAGGAHFERRQPVGMLLDQIGKAEHQPATFGGMQIAPGGGRADRGIESGVDDIERIRCLAPDLGGRGIDERDDVSGDRNRRAADKGSESRKLCHVCCLLPLRRVCKRYHMSCQRLHGGSSSGSLGGSDRGGRSSLAVWCAVPSLAPGKSAEMGGKGRTSSTEAP